MMFLKGLGNPPLFFAEMIFPLYYDYDTSGAGAEKSNFLFIKRAAFSPKCDVGLCAVELNGMTVRYVYDGTVTVTS